MGRFSDLAQQWGLLTQATAEPSAEMMEGARLRLRGLVALCVLMAAEARAKGDGKKAVEIESAVRDAVRPPWRK